MPLLQNPLWTARRQALPPSGYPDATNTPHMLSASVMAYYTPLGVPQAITLQPLPAASSTFGTDPVTGAPNGGAFRDPRGFVQVNAPTVIDGYDFDGVTIGPVTAGPCIVQRCRFRNIDGEDSWAIWVHAEGALAGLTMQDCLCSGTSAAATGPDGLLKMDGSWTGVIVTRCHTVNCSSAVQFAPISGPGTIPYGSQVTGCYFEANSDPSGLGLHLEQVNVSDGTGGLLIRRNHITGPSGQTASIYMSHDFGDVGNVTIDDNLLDGFPQNTIYAGDTGAAGGVLTGGIVVSNNKFDLRGGQNPGGLVIDPAPPDGRLIAAGNVSWPSLAPISGL